ncbi:MAG: hypothetical protein PHV02_10655 [Rhodocyclaceae bacterium]|nr:hypothetical protein [Rhodocyclaceae bacterium]
MKRPLQILFCLLAMLASPLHAVTAMPIPVVVAESEDFEIVGRLEEKTFIFFVDRNKSNAPVLAASLEVEQGDKKAIARFRPETGDYLIDDAGFLARFAQPGVYPLSFTLIVGDESDLLSANFAVNSALTVTDAGERQLGGWLLPIALIALAGGAVWYFVKRRKGGEA